MYYLPQIHMVYKGLAGWLTRDYSVRGHKLVYLVKLPTSRLERSRFAADAIACPGDSRLGVCRMVGLALR
jgi:hypothetical protein